jgi:hypothetical protein
MNRREFITLGGAALPGRDFCNAGALFRQNNPPLRRRQPR